MILSYRDAFPRSDGCIDLNFKPPLRFGDFDKFSNLHFSKNRGMLTALLQIIENYNQTEEMFRRAVKLIYCSIAIFRFPVHRQIWELEIREKSFTYLLLDPQITFTDITKTGTDESLLFRRFIAMIFYIGKVKGARRDDHLKEAYTLLLEARPVKFI